MVAAAGATDLDLTSRELSALARRGAPLAAWSVSGGFSHLRTTTSDRQCAAERIEAAFELDVRSVIGLVPEFKHTSYAHREATESHLYQGRLAYIHDALVHSFARPEFNHGSYNARLVVYKF